MHDPSDPIASRFRAGLPKPVIASPKLPRYMFTGGNNERESVPVEELAAAAQAAILREGRQLALYHMGASPLGHEGLRRFVCKKLLKRGTRIGIESTLITGGSGTGLDLVNNVLLEAGDVVLFEEFSYSGAIENVREKGVDIVPVALDDDGIVIASLEVALERLAREGRPAKYLYTIPTVQNPTGTILPLERRLQIIALARQHGFTIFEDDCYSDIVWEPGDVPPSFLGLAPDVTIHIGSFSKNLVPALRLGYLSARPEVVAQIAALKRDGGTGALGQMIAAEFLEQRFDQHITRLTTSLKRKRDVIVEAVEGEFGTAANIWMPKGGIYIWVKLPDGVDTRALLAPAAANDLSFNAGPDWAVDGDRSASWFRLCFALATDEEIREGVRLLAQISHDICGIPEISRNVANVRHQHQ